MLTVILDPRDVPQDSKDISDFLNKYFYYAQVNYGMWHDSDKDRVLIKSIIQVYWEKEDWEKITEDTKYTVIVLNNGSIAQYIKNEEAYEDEIPE